MMIRDLFSGLTIFRYINPKENQFNSFCPFALLLIQCCRSIIQASQSFVPCSLNFKDAEMLW